MIDVLLSIALGLMFGHSLANRQITRAWQWTVAATVSGLVLVVVAFGVRVSVS